ncbi:class I SAM-dependent methyltransferase [Desulfocurvus vexinensis]|uniref:class I SAM-dependent methyltransferase n=1 Tax=Desulfocurvus vexinensis TaxID=399548 RepID=UPI0004921DFA|nr:class I SAM-dependent methyltransferase [Desulfocurvus vexinensis]
MKCRHCNTPLEHVFVDLGTAPPSNAFLTAEQLGDPEVYYPLKLLACHQCHLVQVDEHASCKDIFCADYVYFSSFSSTWLDHARRYVDMAQARFGLNARSLVVEIASNDGYLLQYVQAKGIPCLGVEPTLRTAEAARAKGIEVETEFFGRDYACGLVRRRGRAALVVGNNVLAHVPDLNDFVAGLAELAAPGGTVTMEFPHLLRLVEGNQFDTIYHEHFSYFSLHTVRRVFAAQGLEIYDVQDLPTHGGSLRIFAGHAASLPEPVGPAVGALLAREQAAGMLEMAFYQGFQAKAERVKNELLEFLLDARRRGRQVAAYGAAAKGNTLLNYCGVRPDLVRFVVDRSPHKQGRFLPGSRIPVVHPDEIARARPDYVLILPWNIREEIMADLHCIKEWGGAFVCAIPGITVLE